MPLTYPIDRPTCNSVTDAELGQVMASEDEDKKDDDDDFEIFDL